MQNGGYFLGLVKFQIFFGVLEIHDIFFWGGGGGGGVNSTSVDAGLEPTYEEKMRVPPPTWGLTVLTEGLFFSNICRHHSLHTGLLTTVHSHLSHDCKILPRKWNIRIYHECDSRIEQSIPRIAVWHHEACRVMTNSDHEGLIFLSYPNTNNGFFFLLTTVFIYLLIYFK